ncbi:MAG: hypothetical protein K0Q87_4007 [Neobacillus sp.]|jgi:hypothetical protein|nr:hypothetical protein [Neobacillus sp.]
MAGFGQVRILHIHVGKLFEEISQIVEQFEPILLRRFHYTVNDGVRDEFDSVLDPFFVESHVQWRKAGYRRPILL